MRAICFLISEVAREVVLPHRTDERRGVWRTDPFFYAAFRIAVGHVLEALAPLGEIKAPKITMVGTFPGKEERRHAGATHLLKSFEFLRPVANIPPITSCNSLSPCRR